MTIVVVRGVASLALFASSAVAVVARMHEGCSVSADKLLLALASAAGATGRRLC